VILAGVGRLGDRLGSMMGVLNDNHLGMMMLDRDRSLIDYIDHMMDLVVVASI
jgi:hypothetical protein